MRVRILDLETQNHPYLGAVASPHCPDNYVVEAGWRDDQDAQPGPVQSRRFNSYAEWVADRDAERSDWFNLDGVDILVCHNAMYELSWFITHYQREFLPFLKRGGRVLCTQLGEYLVTHQQVTYPALGETAPKYGGTAKIDAVKMEWERGVLTADIDPALLHEYLCGPSGDIDNTARCFYGQMEYMVKMGMWRMFLERCEGMVCFAFCEAAGLYVDQQVAHANLREQEAELAAISAEVKKLLPELPEHFEFNWGSDFHVSALLFGGEVKYQQRVPRTDADGNIMYEKADCYRFGKDFYAHIEHITDEDASAYVQEHGNIDRYSAGKNKGQPKVHKVVTTTPQTKWEDTTFRFTGLLPIKAMPKVLADKFAFDPNARRNGEYVGKRFLPCGTPVYSTGKEVLEALSVHGFAAGKLLHRLAQLEKDNGTYYISYEYNKDGSVKKTKGMLQYVGPDGIIHHDLNVAATVTGRLSSSKPNLQNLPRGDKDDEGVASSKVKEMFTSRFGADGSILEVDYTALEVVMLAALSGDEALLKHLQNGTDMHCLRLAAKLKRPYEEILGIVADKKHSEHNSIKRQRTEIKPPSFAAQYGASAAGIAFATGVTVEYAEEFLATEARLFPRAIAFREVVRGEVVRTSALPGGLQREMDDAGVYRTYRRGYYQADGGTCYSFRQFEQWNAETRRREMDFKATQIANYWCQGESGYLMTLSAGRVMRWLIHHPAFLKHVFIVNNVHDALYLDLHNDYKREIALAVKAIMEDAPRYMSEQLGYNISHVPFPAVAEAGPSMAVKAVVV